MKKIPGLVKALKAQAIFYLTNTNTSWQSGWAVDNTWSSLMFLAEMDVGFVTMD